MSSRSRVLLMLAVTLVLGFAFGVIWSTSGPLERRGDSSTLHTFNPPTSGGSFEGRYFAFQGQWNKDLAFYLVDTVTGTMYIWKNKFTPMLPDADGTWTEITAGMTGSSPLRK